MLTVMDDFDRNPSDFQDQQRLGELPYGDTFRFIGCEDLWLVTDALHQQIDKIQIVRLRDGHREWNSPDRFVVPVAGHFVEVE